jgi:hypothetical protein
LIKINKEIKENYSKNHLITALKMKVYLIILLIYFNSTVSQLLNNESLLVFDKLNSHKNKGSIGLFTVKFGKTLKQINESDSEFLAEVSSAYIEEIDYSLSANIIIWREHQLRKRDEEFDMFDVFYAIPINKR